MRVLFISSGNKKESVNPLIKAQGDSLEKIGCQINYFLITGSGFEGYLKQVPVLKKYLSENNFDVIHAHYSYSGFAAALAGVNPLVVSLMGSDVNANSLQKFLIIPFYKLFWRKTIVKSQRMYEKLRLEKLNVIPNGVDTDKFKSVSREESMQVLNWEEGIHILFAANPNRQEKNFNLAKESIEELKKILNRKINLHVLDNVPHKLVPYMMSACNVILLTSKWEGSPNVIKEAMSCNRPIVSTDVGDVASVTKGVSGTYISNGSVHDTSMKLLSAYEFSLKFWSTNGRERIFSLKIDSTTIAGQLSELYKSCI
ncbi:MAG: glycosyltransferase [Balneola sp.]